MSFALPSYPVLVTIILGLAITLNAVLRMSVLNKRILITGFERNSYQSSMFLTQLSFGILTILFALTPQKPYGVTILVFVSLMSLFIGYVFCKPLTWWLNKRKTSKRVNKAYASVLTDKINLALKEWSDFGDMICIPVDKIGASSIEQFVKSYHSRVIALQKHGKELEDNRLEVNGFRYLGSGDYHSSWLCLKNGLVYKERKNWLSFDVSKADFERINLMSEIDMEKLFEQGARHAFTTSILVEVSDLKAHPLDFIGFGGQAVITVQEYVQNSVPVGSSSPFELNLVTEDFGFDVHNGKIGRGSIEKNSPVIYDCILPRYHSTISYRDYNSLQ